MIIKYIILGYLISGIFSSASYPNINRFLLILTWPFEVYKSIVNQPPKTKFNPITGLSTVISIWAVVSLFVFVASYPSKFIENQLLSLLVTIAMFGIGIVILGKLGGKIMQRNVPSEGNLKQDLISIMKDKGWSKEASEAGAFLVIDTLSQGSATQSSIDQAIGELTSNQLEEVTNLIQHYDEQMLNNT